ncbi:MAG: response regulator [Candidatus Omnitrophota bacterium]
MKGLILIVEKATNRAFAKALENMLEAEGCETKTVFSPENVYMLHLVHNYDSIFMDIELWSIRYPSFIRELKRINPDTRIILTREEQYSGHILKDAVDRGYEHIPKPFVEREVMAMLEGITERADSTQPSEAAA